MADITITLYQCGDDKRVVKKTLSNTHTFEKITIKDECSITRPVFLLGAVTGSEEAQDTVGWWRQFNYCYCPNFDRYYIIDNITFTRNRLVQLTCTCDVLMSYKDDILKSKQLISRQENRQQKYLPDQSLPIHSQVKTQISTFGARVGGDGHTIVLITSGKDSPIPATGGV